MKMKDSLIGSVWQNEIYQYKVAYIDFAEHTNWHFALERRELGEKEWEYPFVMFHEEQEVIGFLENYKCKEVEL